MEEVRGSSPLRSTPSFVDPQHHPRPRDGASITSSSFPPPAPGGGSRPTRTGRRLRSSSTRLERPRRGRRWPAAAPEGWRWPRRGRRRRRPPSDSACSGPSVTTPASTAASAACPSSASVGTAARLTMLTRPGRSPMLWARVAPGAARGAHRRGDRRALEAARRSRASVRIRLVGR
jgi:hypothetical protein